MKSKIVSQGFCTLCGACEAACPVDAIKVDEEGLRYDDCSDFLDFCPICYDICPHTEPLLMEAMRFVADAPMRGSAIGHYRKILLAQATDERTREMSRGGGVVTAILAQAIEDGMIDSAVTSESEPQAPLKLKPRISLVPDDVLSAIDSKFTASSVAKAFGSAVRDYGKAKIAFVGVPHQVLAIRKLEAWEHKIMSSLEVTVGLFCLWVFSLNKLLRHLERELGLRHSDVVRMDLTDKYEILTSGGTVRIPVEKIRRHVLNKCRTCMDFTSELADISVGGAPPLRGWSTVIIRTGKGQELFKNALERKVVRATGIEEHEEAFEHLMFAAIQKKKLALREAKRLRARGLSIPPADLDLAFLQREKSIMSGTRVGDAMTKDVMTVDPKTSVERLLDTMMKHHHMGYPVVDGENKLVGIVAFEDIMKVRKEERGRTLVEDIMKKRLVTANPGDSVLEAFEKMSDRRIGHLLVVDPGDAGVLLGILTRTDVMRSLERAFLRG
ncbi:MAG: Coenzyme F420 hydrogenase/dehydrogenase, beta subunit C-terminal domain [Thermoproteota archaeon]